jgi:hypothetical protein
MQNTPNVFRGAGLSKQQEAYFERLDEFTNQLLDNYGHLFSKSEVAIPKFGNLSTLRQKASNKRTLKIFKSVHILQTWSEFLCIIKIHKS